MRDLHVLRGRVWLFGDNVDTDQIIPGRYLTILDYSEMARHAMEPLRPDFASEVRRGDIILAGRDFGSGSSREEAPMVLRELGISCVIAETFSRIFFRNAINVGLPAFALHYSAPLVAEGAELEVHPEKGYAVVVETGEPLEFEPLPPFLMGLLRAGGAVEKFVADGGMDWEAIEEGTD